MTDKELIKDAIRKRIVSINSCPFITAEFGSEKYAEGQLYAYGEILSIIDSIPEEPASEDLEETANFYANTHTEWFDSEGNPHVMPAFKAGAEWQKEKMNLRLQTEYEKGLFDMRNEMMKDALETNLYLDGKFLTVDYDFSEQGYQECDRIKFVIIKEE